VFLQVLRCRSDQGGGVFLSPLILEDPLFGRRGLAALALACVASLGLASMASAATTAKLDIKLSSAKAGTSKKPKAVKLNFDLAVDTDDGTSPPTTKETVVSFSKGIKFNSNIFPSCTLATLNSKGPSACAKGSKVGTGSAVALVGGSPGEPKPTTTETLKVTAYNGPQGKSLLLYLDGDSPAVIKQAIEGKLTKASSPFGYQLDVTIPPNLQQPVPGVFAPLVDFKVNAGATLKKKKGKKTVKINYIETTSCPSGSAGKGWPFKADLTFANDPGIVSGAIVQTCS
jgi:hypothetical protein